MIHPTTVDVLILGATGYTGKLIVDYLYKHPQRSSPGFSLALGARSKSRLDELAKTLSLSEDIQLWTVDVNDEASLEQAIRQSKVVINTVGPYWTIGIPVVKFCARHGVHYLDLTGEPHFVMKLIEQFDYLANKKDAIIIPAAGMDSIPSDVVTYLSNKTLKSKLGPDASMEDSVTSYRARGSISGGTLATAISYIEDVPPKLMALATKPYSLSTSVKGLPDPPNRLYYTMPHITPTRYGAHWVMRVINRPIVQRTWALFEIAKIRSPKNAALAYGSKFRCDEVMAVPGLFGAVAFTIGLGILAVSLLIKPIRELFKKYIPQPGAGTKPPPNPFLEVVNVSTSNGLAARTTLYAKGEPGYLLAAHMIAESALSIALNKDEIPYKLVGGAGILTTMTALGDVLIERLRKYANFTIESEIISDESRKDR